MTGYGKGEASVANKKICVEIRTLNGKQLDLSLKMPQIYRSEEFALRSLISKSVVRGKCDVFVSYETVEAQSSTSINAQMYDIYYNQMAALSQKYGFDMSSGEVVHSILRMPDVMQSAQVTGVDKAELEALHAATAMALEHLSEFRYREGAVLMTDILSRIDIIESLQEEVKKHEVERIDAVKARLKESIDSMAIAVDENRFEQELIYYLEKLDITEEMVRLSQHIAYFREVCSSEADAGRKLGFISQELGREINTTGSKANHKDIQRAVVRMKDELEKIKEQSLNVL